MKLFDNLRKKIVRKLIRPDDGYTFTGFRNGEPIKFYYQPDTDKYLVGMRSDTMYYFEPTLSGWSSYSSRYLPWGEEVETTTWKRTFNQEPQEIDFQTWMYGILKNIFEQYSERLDTLSKQELKQIRDYKLKEKGELFVINKNSFCDIMDGLRSYWDSMRQLEDILNVYFEENMMTDVFNTVVNGLEEDLEPNLHDDDEPTIFHWFFTLDSGRDERAKEGIDGYSLTTAEELYDYLIWKKDKT